MEYITFMHNNVDTQPTKEEWDRFFETARESGVFRGGSAIGKRSTVGNKEVPDVTGHINGYMLFESATLDELTKILEHHPIVLHGGTVEICELPKT